MKRAARGEEIRIGAYGKPMVRLVPDMQPAKKPRKLGALKGKIWIADDFDKPMMDLWDIK